MPSRFKLNSGARRSIERMARGERDRKAAAVAGTARALAPVLTGAYRESISVESGDDDARVTARVPYADFVEARDAVLARALAARAE